MGFFEASLLTKIAFGNDALEIVKYKGIFKK